MDALKHTGEWGNLPLRYTDLGNNVFLPQIDTLATPSTSRVQATSSVAASITLSTTCRRVSMYATQGTWYSLSGNATASSHYIAAGERLDFDVAANTTISVLRENLDGSIRITELV